MVYALLLKLLIRRDLIALAVGIGLIEALGYPVVSPTLTFVLDSAIYLGGSAISWAMNLLDQLISQLASAIREGLV